ILDTSNSYSGTGLSGFGGYGSPQNMSPTDVFLLKTTDALAKGFYSTLEMGKYYAERLNEILTNQNNWSRLGLFAQPNLLPNTQVPGMILDDPLKLEDPGWYKGPNRQLQ